MTKYLQGIYKLFTSNLQGIYKLFTSYLQGIYKYILLVTYLLLVVEVDELKRVI